MMGSSSFKMDHVAKALQPKRLRFGGKPTFDAMPFLDDGNQRTFERPLDYALAPDVEEYRPPKVRMRIQEKDKMEFVELLDSCDCRAERSGQGQNGVGRPSSKQVRKERTTLDTELRIRVPIPPLFCDRRGATAALCRGPSGVLSCIPDLPSPHPSERLLDED